MSFKMFKYGILVTFAAIVLAEENNMGDLEAIIQDIFGEPCTLENKVVGSCVKYYLCNANGTVVRNGMGVLNSRNKRGSCSNFLDVCCLHDTMSRTSSNNGPQMPQQKKGCGWRNRKGLGMQPSNLKKDESKFGEFSWMAVLLKKEQSDKTKGVHQSTYVGGASIIHPSVVLTAAHVVTGSNLFIRAGEWDTQSNDEPYPYQDRDIKEIVIHEEFNKLNLHNDIALLFLTKPLELAPNVGLVCLPLHNSTVDEGLRCVSSGWGKDKFGNSSPYRVVMKKVEVPTINNEKCQSAFRMTRLGTLFNLHSSFMCAGGEDDEDTCQGDGGSPLVCPIGNDRYIQSGIVAWGIGCGLKDTPGAYTNVTYFRQWVDKNVKDRGYDPAVYTY